MDRIVSLKKEIISDYGFDEAIKTLRTNVQFCGTGVRVVMLTSSVPDEGKSDLSFSLTVSMAQIGKKVLFIDADIRKSVFHARYRPDIEMVGLSQYLSGQNEMDEIIYKTNYENLSIIIAGPYSPNASELLEESLFTGLLTFARQVFDYVFIDTPPMAALIDGAIIARRCDGAILVIESGAVSYKLVQRVKGQLEKSGCRILGTVLNKDKNSQKGYYSNYKKYKKYSN